MPEPRTIAAPLGHCTGHGTHAGCPGTVPGSGGTVLVCSCVACHGVAG